MVIKKNITKAECIRLIAQNDMSLPNNVIKKVALRQYGLVVESNQITKELGRYADRQFSGPIGQTHLKLAREFVRKIGDIRHAVRLLHLSQAK